MEYRIVLTFYERANNKLIIKELSLLTILPGAGPGLAEASPRRRVSPPGIEKINVKKNLGNLPV